MNATYNLKLVVGLWRDLSALFLLHVTAGLVANIAQFRVAHTTCMQELDRKSVHTSRHACSPATRTKREGSATYRSGELLWLSSLPTLLADWRQRRINSRYIVRREASVQLATHIARIGACCLGTKGAAQGRRETKTSERRLLLAR